MASSDYDNRFPESKSEIIQILARNVRHYRKMRTMSQESLAKKMGVEQQAISLLENGRANPTIETIENLASCLGVTFHDLFERKPPRP